MTTAETLAKTLGGRETGAGKGVGLHAPLDPALRRPLANERALHDPGFAFKCKSD